MESMTKFKQLMDLLEDLYLSKLAEKLDVDGAKLISHTDAWNIETRDL